MNGCVRYIQLRNFLNIFRVNIVKFLSTKNFFYLLHHMQMNLFVIIIIRYVYIFNFLKFFLKLYANIAKFLPEEIYKYKYREISFFIYVPKIV